MPVEGVGSTPVTSVSAALEAARTTSAVPAAKEQFGQDTFLKLLVAQLRYQDPTNPSDGAEFLAQTAQFTSLEKLTEVAKLETELLTAQRVLGASSLVGRTVTYPRPDGTEATGLVTSARFSTDGPVLTIGGDAANTVPLASVREVRSTST